MSKFKKPPSKQVDNFINNAAMSTSRKSKNENLQTMTTRIQSDYLEKLKALAYFSRTSQREVIEAALDGYFENHKKELSEALKLFDVSK